MKLKDILTEVSRLGVLKGMGAAALGATGVGRVGKAPSSATKISSIVRALDKHPSLKLHSTEDGRGSRRAWIDIVGNIKSSEVLQILQAVDKAARKEKVDLGFGTEIIFRGSNWNVKVVSAAESGEDHNTLFVEVFKPGAIGGLARAGIDEPESY